MCGIVGIWHRDGQPIDLAALHKATALLRHRGPDDEGYLLINKERDRVIPCGGKGTDSRLGLPQIEDFLGQPFDLAFGFRRLAVLDLSPSGHQPMSNEDEQLWIVLNGEIYNYLELRQDLEGRGHTFRSQSDTETLLHGYEEYGERLLDHLNGMFAFCLWDRRQQRLLCARDRLGIKPLYYFQDPEAFLFASEIKAILALGPELRSPNYPYLKDFVRTGLLDEGPSTLFNQIHHLEPAHYLLLSSGSSSQERYWDFDAERARGQFDYLHPGKTLRSLLQEAVQYQLRSDVPVGTCLSGGLDSSSLVALASSMLSQPMKSFSSVYEEEGYDEGRFVKIAASAFHTDSHVVQPTPAHFLCHLRQITWHMDEPTAGPGVYSQWFVMQSACGKVKVLLDGQGGDELLGGYYYYFFPYLLSLWRRFIAHQDPRLLARMATEALQIWRLVQGNYQFLGLRPFARKVLQRMGIRPGGAERSSIFHPDFERSVPSLESKPQALRLADPLSDRLYWDVVKNSIPALLHYEDRNSMAFGIEARVPLLDHRLVEFCLGLPPEQKIRGNRTKVLLREVMSDMLPPAIVNRQDKKGYPTPLALWLRDGLYHEVREFLLSPRVRERAIFDTARMGALLEEHHSGRRDLSWEIWRWISCELWFQTFLEGGSAPGAETQA